jgi:hypothetical protein
MIIFSRRIVYRKPPAAAQFRELFWDAVNQGVSLPAQSFRCRKNANYVKVASSGRLHLGALKKSIKTNRFFAFGTNSLPPAPLRLHVGIWKLDR